MTRGQPMSGRRGPVVADGGFSLLEVIVSIALVGTVMAALATFYVSSMTATHAQSARQTAAQLANDGMERARTRSGPELLAGRDADSVAVQWSAGRSGAVTGVASYLAETEAASDPGAASGAGASAVLPTEPVTVSLNGRSYRQHWYVGWCWQATGGGTCDTDDSRPVPLLRVIVAVTWSDQDCAERACSFVTATLIAGESDDPIFNIHQGARPTVTDPGAQVDNAGGKVSLQVTGTGAVAPLSWTATGLPTGLSIDSGGRISGTPTAAGTYAVTVRLTDGLNRAGTASFTWTING